MTDLAQRLKVALRLADEAARTGLVAYHNQLVIDSRPEARLFRRASDPWQWERVNRVRHRVEYLAGLTGDGSGPRFFFDTYPRGHDKSAGVGRVLNWLLAYSRHPLNMYAAAGDEDQAALLREAMEAEIGLNPWLKARITVANKTVYGPGGRLRILTSDAPTSFGYRADLVVLDELTHWKKRSLFDALYSGLHKRPGSMLWIIGNAGELDTWQWDLHQLALLDPSRWSVFDSPPDVTLASWLSADDVADIARHLPPGLARRVIGNHWVAPGEGSGYLDLADVMKCVDPEAPVHESGQNGVLYWIGLDYGPKKDRTVAVVLHKDRGSGQVVIDRMKIWQGSRESPVLLADVESWVRDARELYPFCELVADPYQLEGTVQDMQAEGMTVQRFEPRGGKSNYEMAESLRHHVVNGLLRYRPDAGVILVPDAGGTLRPESFADELQRLVIKPTAYGYRFDHTIKFHDDRACAVGMALVKCVESPIYPGGVASALPKKTRELGPAAKDDRGSKRDREKDGGRGNFKGLWGT